MAKDTVLLNSDGTIVQDADGDVVLADFTDTSLCDCCSDNPSPPDTRCCPANYCFTSKNEPSKYSYSATFNGTVTKTAGPGAGASSTLSGSDSASTAIGTTPGNFPNCGTLADTGSFFNRGTYTAVYTGQPAGTVPLVNSSVALVQVTPNPTIGTIQIQMSIQNVPDTGSTAAAFGRISISTPSGGANSNNSVTVSTNYCRTSMSFSGSASGTASSGGNTFSYSVTGSFSYSCDNLVPCPGVGNAFA